MITPTAQQFIDAVAAGMAKQGTLGTRRRLRDSSGRCCALGAGAKVLGRPAHRGRMLAAEAGGEALAESLAYAHDRAARVTGDGGKLDRFWAELRRVCVWFGLEIPDEAAGELPRGWAVLEVEVGPDEVTDP